MYSKKRLTPNGNQNNTVVIDIDINQMKAMYPFLDFKNQMTMQNISEQIVQGVKVKQGKLEYDKTYINPEIMAVRKININEDNLKQTEKLAF